MTPKLQKLICDLVDEVNIEIDTSQKGVDAPLARFQIVDLKRALELSKASNHYLMDEIEIHKEKIKQLEAEVATKDECVNYWKGQTEFNKEKVKQLTIELATGQAILQSANAAFDKSFARQQDAIVVITDRLRVAQNKLFDIDRIVNGDEK